MMPEPSISLKKTVRIYTTEEFKVFNTFYGIKQHLTQVKFIYNQNKFVRNETTYYKCKQKWVFNKLAKHEDYFGYILSNLIHDPYLWVGDLLNSEREQIYKSWISRNQRLTYQFKEEIISLLPNYEENFLSEVKQHPHVLSLFLSGQICIETFIILLDITNSFKVINKNLKDDLLWKEISLRVRKYKYFMDYDKNKMRKALLDRFSYKYPCTNE